MKKFRVFLAFVLVIVCCFGFVGCEEVVGPAGADGKSAYDIWLGQGHSGSQADFLEWLKGEAGSSGTNGTAGTNGADGKSAYDIWLGQGYEGTEADFLEWLKGADGKNGRDGWDGSRGPAGAKGEDGEDSPYGAMAVEVTTAREFLDALEPRLKKEVIVLKNDIDFSKIEGFSGTIGFEGINRTIVGCDVDVYHEGTNKYIETRPATLFASVSISDGDGGDPANVKFFNVDIMPIKTANADTGTAEDENKDKIYQAGVVVAKGSTLEMYQSRISMDQVEYDADAAVDLECRDDLSDNAYDNVYVSYGLYIAADAGEVYLENVTIDNSNTTVGGKYALWSSSANVTIYLCSFYGRRYAIGLSTDVSLVNAQKMFVVALDDKAVVYEKELGEALEALHSDPHNGFYGAVFVMGNNYAFYGTFSDFWAA